MIEYVFHMIYDIWYMILIEYVFFNFLFLNSQPFLVEWWWLIRFLLKISPCCVSINMFDMGESYWVWTISSSSVALAKPLFPHLLKILVKLWLLWLLRTFVLLVVLLGLGLLFLKLRKLLPLLHKLALQLLQLKPLLRMRLTFWSKTFKKVWWSSLTSTPLLRIRLIFRQNFF